MREIKFRIWHNIDKKMYHPPEVHESHFGKYLIRMDGLVYYDEGKWQDVRLLQFTGLKDDEGVEIYEGDVVQYTHRSLLSLTEGIEYYDHTFVGIVAYSDKYASFGLSMECHIELFYQGYLEYNTYNHLVIGNIYEHPELSEHIS